MAVVIEENLSKRIHSLRFLLIVFVVFIHNGAIDAGVNYYGGTQTFEVPLYVTKIKELVGAFTVIAVPLFFLISGFLLYNKNPKFLENLKKKCRTILLPYVLWTILMILFLFVAQSISFLKPYFATTIIRNFTVIDWIDAFVGKFTAARAYMYPLVGQFWFLRDLFILNLLFTVIKKLIDWCPGGAFVIFFLLWIGGMNIYIVNPAALFFFSLGYYIVKYNIDYKHIDNIKIIDISFMYAITIVTSLFLKERMPIIHAVNTIVGVMFFLKISFYFIQGKKTFQTLSWLEQYAFWVYATHNIVLWAMVKLSVMIIPVHDGWLLVHYFMVTSLCIILLVGIGFIFRRMFPRIFSILSGGRV